MNEHRNRQLHVFGRSPSSPRITLMVLGGTDVLAGTIAWLLVALLVGRESPADVVAFAAVAILTQFGIGLAVGLYRRRVLIGSAAELRLQALCSVSVLAVLVPTGALISERRVAASTIVSAWLLTLVLIIAARHGMRLLLDRRRRPHLGTPVVVVGAGLAGTTLVEQMLRDRGGEYLPVAFVDDDPGKRRLSFRGVRVRGTTGHLASVIAASGAEGAVVAIGRAEPELFRTLAAQLSGSRAWVRTIPSVTELLGAPHDDTAPGSTIPVSAIREIDVADLIGRPTTVPDLGGARELIQGRRVLVTGAGGSIGSELCRQIHALGPAELFMLDRDESALHGLSMSMYGRGLLDTPDMVLADIRDARALGTVFDRCRPDIVFHAAALKHLPLLQSHPLEAWKTNVHGTQNVIDAATRYGVRHFVNISTDKAAHPTSTLGASKRTAEGLTTHAAARTGDRYVSVRFGNVIGSRGSAIPAFADQIRRGGPVTVTDPEVTRYFMTIPEACALVLFAMAVGSPGETLVLDMGRPVAIKDVATKMMHLMGRPCPITYTGLRPGEKLHETLFTPEENEIVARHDRVFHVLNAGIDPHVLPDATSGIARITRFAGTWVPDSDPGAWAGPETAPAAEPTSAAEPTRVGAREEEVSRR